MEKKLLKTVSIETLIFMLITHGFCYLNIIFSHDSINIFHSGYYGDSIGIGRFLIPVWNYLRGEYYPPLLIGVLSICFFILINYIIIKLFDIKDNKTILSICGILTTCTNITLLNATYINYSDMYIFSILLDVLAVYLMRRKDKISILAIIAIFISLGIYQSYIGITIGLSMILLIKDLLDKEESKKIIKKGIIYVIQIIIGLTLYMIATKIIPHITNIALTNNYNSVSNVGNYGGIRNMIKAFFNTYTNYKDVLLLSTTFHKRITTIANILFTFISLFYLGKQIITKKLKLDQNILIILLLISLPFGLNVIYFISNGVVHGLMTFPVIISYVFMLYILLNNKNKVIDIILSILLFIMIGSNIVFANQVYEKKQMEFDSTKMTLNRIIYRIEQIEGYEAGKTPIVFVGGLNYGPLKVKKDKMDYTQVGLFPYYSVTYPQTYYRFIYYYLGYPIDVYENTEADRLNKEYKENEEVKNMNPFPAKDSIKMIDDKIIVKLS